MAEAEMSSLEFTIEYETTNATKSLNSLNRSLNKTIKTMQALSGINSGAENITGLAKAINTLSQAKISSSIATNLGKIIDTVRTIKVSDIMKAQQLGSALQEIGKANIGNIGRASKGTAQDKNTTDPQTEKSSKELSVLSKSLQAVREKFQVVDKGMTAIETAVDKVNQKYGNFTSGLSTALQQLGTGALNVDKHFAGMISNATIGRVKRFGDGLAGLVSSLGRIAMYRAIRGFIKNITEGFNEGIKNVYAYSDAINGRLANSLDSIATSMNYLKNSTGAMAAPLINAVAPAVDFLIDKFVALLNVVNQVFARLTGASTWTRAIKQASKWGDAAAGGAGKAKKAVEDLKRTILGFDEINKMDDNKNNGSGSGSGGSGSGGGGGLAFEEVPIDSKISDFVDQLKDAFSQQDWEGLGTLLGDKFNEVVDSIDWKGWGTKIGKGIDAGIQISYYTLKTMDFRNLGEHLGNFVTNAVGSINWNIAGRLLIRGFTAKIDLLIGFVQGLDPAVLGKSIGDFIIGAFSEAKEWALSYDWGELGTNLGKGIKLSVTSVDWNSVASSLVDGLGALSTGAWDFITNLGYELSEPIYRAFYNLAPEMWDGLAKGIKDFFSDPLQWLDTYILIPFDNAMKSLFGLGSGSSKVTEEYGNDIASGINVGICGNVHPLLSTVDGLFNNINTTATSTWEKIKSDTVTKWNAIKDKVTTSASTLKEKAVSSFTTMKDRTVESAERIKANVIDKFNTLKENAIAKFTGIKDGIVGKIQAAKDAIARIVETMKSFFNFTWSLPHIKLPHFSITPRGWNVGDLLKGSIPRLGIEWYAKGGIMNGAQIFGLNGNNLMVGGEKGREAVLPLDANTEWMDKVADRVVAKTNKMDDTQSVRALLRATNEQNKLLRQQNEYLRNIQNKDTTTVISTSEITAGMKRRNRRHGKTVVPVGG